MIIQLRSHRTRRREDFAAPRRFLLAPCPLSACPSPPSLVLLSLPLVLPSPRLSVIAAVKRRSEQHFLRRMEMLCPVSLLKVLQRAAQERTRLSAPHAVQIPRRRDGEKLPFLDLANKIVCSGKNARRHAEGAGDGGERLSAADAVDFGADELKFHTLILCAKA